MRDILTLPSGSCDAGYYCTHDAAGTTICCPAGSDLVACKALFPSAKGDLVSDPPASKVVSSTAAGGTGTVSGANPTGTGSLGASGGVSGAGSRTGTFTGGAPLATGPGGSSTNIAVAPAPTGLGGAVVAAVVAGAAIVAL